MVRSSLPVGDSRAAFISGMVLLIAGLLVWLLPLWIQFVLTYGTTATASTASESSWLPYVLPIAVPTWLAVLVRVALNNAHRAGRWLLVSVGVMLLLVLIAMIATSIVPNNTLGDDIIRSGVIYLPALPTSYLFLIGKRRSPSRTSES